MTSAFNEGEDAGGGTSSYVELLEEIAELKAELQVRQEEVRIVIVHPWYPLTACQVDELRDHKYRQREWVRSSPSPLLSSPQL